MILDATDLSLELILAGAVTANEAQFVADYVEITSAAMTPGVNYGTTNGAAAVTAVAAPGGADTQRQIKSLIIYNADTASITLTVRLNHNDTDYRTVWNGALATDEALGFSPKGGFEVYDTAGAKYWTKPNIGLGGNRLMDLQYEMNIAGAVGLLRDGSTGFTMISDKAYWVYVGYVIRSFIARYIGFAIIGAGTGAQTAEVALVSSPSAPNKANQVLTKLLADGTLEPFNSLLVETLRNANPFNYRVKAGIHLWIGLRCAMGSTQPSIPGLASDFSQGTILSTAVAGALTGAGPWTGSIITQSTSSVCPDLRLYTGIAAD